MKKAQGLIEYATIAAAVAAAVILAVAFRTGAFQNIQDNLSTDLVDQPIPADPGGA